MNVAPAVRRWALRLGLAMVVAVAIGYLPGGMVRRDPRAIKLEQQLAEQHVAATELEAANARLAREIEAQRTDVHAIERRARVDLGMVYSDEIVMRIRREGEP